MKSQNTKYTTTFYFGRSTWDLYAQLTASYNITESNTTGYNEEINLSPTLGYIISPEVVRLSSEEEKFLREGLKMVSVKLDQNVQVQIHNIDIIDTDFQPEALYCVVLRWAEDVFEQDYPIPPIRFDATQRRYIVTIE